MAEISTSDTILIVVVLALFAAASILLFITGARHERRERQRILQWNYDYFRRGGLVTALMARWKRQGQLTDQRVRTRQITPTNTPLE